MKLIDVLLDPKDKLYFSQLTEATCLACHQSQATPQVRDAHPNLLDFDPVKPGGLKSYPAIWTQDFTMIFASGFISDAVALEHLRIILKTQNGSQSRSMKTGALVPPWAIADHVNFDGSPVFFPGTYSSGDDQGGSYGYRPPYNNYFDVIWLAWMLVSQSESPLALLHEEIEGMTVYERLLKAFSVPPVDAQGIVFTTAAERAVGFIFCDTVHMTGQLLMPTLLRMRAASHMRDLAMHFGDDAMAQYFASEAQRALPHIGQTFAHDSGWLRASTDMSSEPDVFGTLYAMYSHAISGTCINDARKALVNALDRGYIEQDGAIRHVPLNHQFASDATWEKSTTSNNYYQNGGYWFMPAGWLTAVLYEFRPHQARAYLQRYLTALKQEDFRDGNSFAPWEWIFEDVRSENCPVFGPSVTLPYAILTGKA
tara:strand:+ start:5243 stop:6520 length:1278 start_codon:yes stop_codon:yes gene_type:complete